MSTNDAKLIFGSVFLLGGVVALLITIVNLATGRMWVRGSRTVREKDPYFFLGFVSFYLIGTTISIVLAGLAISEEIFGVEIISLHDPLVEGALVFGFCATILQLCYSGVGAAIGWLSPNEQSK